MHVINLTAIRWNACRFHKWSILSLSTLVLYVLVIAWPIVLIKPHRNISKEKATQTFLYPSNQFFWIDIWYPATKATEVLYGGCVSTQHAARYAVFPLRPRGLRSWEKSWPKHSRLSVPQCAITIRETGVGFKCPLQSAWHANVYVFQRQVGSYNPFRLCPSITSNYTSGLPLLFFYILANGTGPNPLT